MEIEPKHYHEQHEEDEHHDGTDTNDSFERILAVQTKEKKRRRQSKRAVKILSLPMPLPTFRPDQGGQHASSHRQVGEHDGFFARQGELQEHHRELRQDEPESWRPSKWVFVYGSDKPQHYGLGEQQQGPQLASALQPFLVAPSTLEPLTPPPFQQPEEPKLASPLKPFPAAPSTLEPLTPPPLFDQPMEPIFNQIIAPHFVEQQFFAPPITPAPLAAPEPLATLTPLIALNLFTAPQERFYQPLYDQPPPPPPIYERPPLPPYEQQQPLYG